MKYAVKHHCPYCGSNNVSYDLEDTEYFEYVVYECTCKDCKTEFNEYYDMVFTEQLITDCKQEPELNEENYFPEPESKE